jgi:hypothetical protein
VSATANLNLTELAAKVVRYFPTLDSLERRLSLALYRLLAQGHPVPRAALAERLAISPETVSCILTIGPAFSLISSEM